MLNRATLEAASTRTDCADPAVKGEKTRLRPRIYPALSSYGPKSARMIGV
jgi:hypothetical protein